MSTAKIIVIAIILNSCPANGFVLNRLDRHCKAKEHNSLSSDQKSQYIEESKFTLLLILISCIIFLLIFLGIIKGLIGLVCFPKVGSYGMHLLIDLPQPLVRYQEKELEGRTVVYDIGGWPIHPDTLQRTVRTLPKRTEFCLNLIFFLAYPIAAFIFLCGFCCCIRSYNKSKDDECFKRVQIVRLTKNLDKNHKKPDDVYREEEQDTKYVIDALKKSKASLDDCDDDCECPGGNKIEED